MATDLTNAALGFMFSIEDQGTATVEKIERRYKSLTRIMGKSEKIINRTSLSTADAIATTAGSFQAMTEAGERAIKVLSRLSKVQGDTAKTTRRHPAQAGRGWANPFTSEKKNASREIRLTPGIPRTKDSHFKKSGIFQAYRDTIHPPEYIGKIPMFAEGGYASKPTLGVFGEAGPEFVLPEDKLVKVLGDAMSRKTFVESELEVTLQNLKIENPSMLQAFLGKGGTLDNAVDKWDELGDEEKQLYKAVTKHSKHMNRVLDREIIGSLEDIDKKIKKTEMGMGDMVKSVASGASEAASAMKEKFTGVAAATGLVSSIKSAGSMDELTSQLATVMDLNEDSKALYKEAIYDSMKYQNTSWDEAKALAAKAADYHLVGQEMQTYMQVAAGSTQILEQFGMSADETADYMWNLKAAGISFEEMPKAIAAMATSARMANVDIRSSMEWVQKYSGQMASLPEDASIAVAGSMSAVKAAFSDSWAQEAGDSIFDTLFGGAFDPDVWGTDEFANTIAAVADTTGQSIDEIMDRVKSGDGANLMSDLIGSVKNLDAVNRGDALLAIKNMFKLEAGDAERFLGHLDDIQGKLKEVGGASANAAKSNDAWEKLVETANAGVWKKWERLWNALGAITGKMGEHILPILEVVFEGLAIAVEEAVVWFDKMPKSMRVGISIISALTAGILALGTGGVYVYTKLSPVIGLVTKIPVVGGLATKVFGWLSTAVGGLSLPLVGVIAAFTALFAILYHGYKVLGGFGGAWDAIKLTMASGWDLIKGIAGDYIGLFGALLRLDFDDFMNHLKGIGEGVLSLVLKPIEWLGNAVDYWFGTKLMEGPGSFAQKFIDCLAGAMVAAYDTVASGLQAIWDFTVKLFSGEFNLTDKIVSGLSTAVSAIWDGIKNVASNLMIGAGNIMTNLGMEIVGSQIKLVSAAGMQLVDTGGGLVKAGAAIAVPAMAQGGVVTKPTLALVGEAGPEVIVPANNGEGIYSLPAGDGEVVTLLTEIRNILNSRLTPVTVGAAKARAGGLRDKMNTWEV